MTGLTGLNTQQVGSCGELFVQYKLLKLGIESAPMTTDYGIDLVALDPKGKSVTIQVKTSRHHADTTSKWLEWNMPTKCVANLVALVDLERDRAWLFRSEEFEESAIRTGDEGRRLWWYVPGHVYETTTAKRREEDFTSYLLDEAVPKSLGQNT